MAKGNRGGRHGARVGGQQGQQGRRRKKERARAAAPPAAQELPTAAPGSQGLPSSIMGGGTSVDVSQAGTRPVRRPEQRRRNRGGPRPESERIARGPKVIYDFRYVRADLQWIALTSVASVVVVLASWAALRA